MDELITAERLSRLIGRIYDCAVDPTRWAETIDAIRAELGFATASLDLFTLPQGEILLNIMANIPEPYAERMLRFGPQIADIWGGGDTLINLPLDEPAVLSRVRPDLEGLWRHPMYVEWAEPQGINDILALWLARDDGATGVIAFGWPAAAGDIGERELRTARILLPHLQRAAAINRLLDLAALQQASFDSLFDTLSVPIVLVDETLAIIHANHAALTVLAEGDPLRARGDTLAAAEPCVSRALAVAVRAASDQASMEREGLGIPVRRRTGGVGALYVLPLRGEVRAAARQPARRLAVAAVFVAQTATPPKASTDLVAALFGLTRAEARVFASIAAGATVAATADLLCVQESTVKTHLIRLYNKTGLRRQVDLVRMGASLAVPAALSSVGAPCSASLSSPL
jgi:DNA-binding CsgD family transcriptional regulator/PAS domain-containing protein